MGDAVSHWLRAVDLPLGSRMVQKPVQKPVPSRTSAPETARSGARGSVLQRATRQLRVLGESRLRLTPATRDRATWRFACAVVAEVGLLRSPARVGVRHPQHCTLSLVDLFAAVVAYKHRFPSHRCPPSQGRFTGETLQKGSVRYAASRARRIRQERSKLSIACSSCESAGSRAPTTRKCRGRKSSIVLPSKYCSRTAGETYELRVTAGVFPRRSATRRMTAVTDRFCSVTDSGNPSFPTRSAK